jgi:hypothetical protein
MDPDPDSGVPKICGTLGTGTVICQKSEPYKGSYGSTTLHQDSSKTELNKIMTLPQIGEVHHLRNASSKVHSSLYSQPSFQSLYTGRDVHTVKCWQFFLKHNHRSK